MTHQHLWRWMQWQKKRLCTLLVAALFCCAPTTLLAQTPTPTVTPGPGGAILPNEKPIATPTPTPGVRFVIGSFRTEPPQPRIEEAFILHLEIENVGTIPASGWAIGIQCPATSNTPTNIIVPTGGCSIPLPEIDAGGSEDIGLGLRAFASDKTKEQSISLVITLINASTGASQPFTIDLFFLPARVIPDEKPALVRPFARPDILIQNTWTARARSTVGELLTPVPLVINSVPVSPPVAGGPEFELVIQLQNQGEVEAANIFVNFCGRGSKFNPVGSSCQKFVPANLPPGGQAIASQTLAYNNTTLQNASQSTTLARGQPITLTITYDFWYVEQWAQERVTQTVYLYPQFYPAATPVPALPTPFLDVSTPVLNVRQGPGTNYLLINPNWGFAYQGERYLITGKWGDWWQIDFRGVTAWVSAYYTIAWGGERVPTATNIPPTPPAAPPPPPSPTPKPNPSPVGMNDAAPALAAVDPGRDSNMESLPAPNAVQEGFVVVNRGAAVETSFNTVSSEPFVVIERYTSDPAQIVGGQPFELELALRNTGQTTARQLILGWRSDQVAPLGAGTTRWLDDLAPGGVVIVSGQFLLADQTLENFIQAPLELLYTDSAGRLVSHVEQIVLLKEQPQGILPTLPEPGQSQRPLWLRLLLGLLGLGAEPR